MVYPSGRIVSYARDAIGRITGVTTKKDSGSSAVTLASGAAYLPFGALTSLTHGNGLVLGRTYDGDFNLTSLSECIARSPQLIALKSLVGLRLSIIRFYANTLGLHFGEIRTRARGGTVGAFALHVSSPWRIDGQSKTITGSADIWEYGGDGARPACWTPEEGPTLLDRKLSEIFGQRDQDGSWRNETDGYCVTAVEATIFGDLIVTLSNELAIRVFPAATKVESWRFFVPDDETPHLTFPAEGE